MTLMTRTDNWPPNLRRISSVKPSSKQSWPVSTESPSWVLDNKFIVSSKIRTSWLKTKATKQVFMWQPSLSRLSQICSQEPITSRNGSLVAQNLLESTTVQLDGSLRWACLLSSLTERSPGSTPSALFPNSWKFPLTMKWYFCLYS